jgi:hypothetical protein
MTNPKQALRFFAAIGIFICASIIAAAILLGDTKTLLALIWFPLLLAASCAVVTGIWMVTLWPLLLLIARAFVRSR